MLLLSNLQCGMFVVVYYVTKYHKQDLQYAVPENIHTPPTEWNFLGVGGGGGSMRQRN